MTKVRLMAADASPALTDLFYMVIDPATTPADRKVVGTAIATMLAAAPAFTGGYAPIGDYVQRFSGGDPTGVADSGPDIQAAIDAALAVPNSSVRTIIFPSGTYRVNATLTVSDRGLNLVGPSRARGTAIKFYGSGELFEIGTDNGQPYDQADYDGIQSFYMQDIALTTSTDTALDNGQGNYRAGTYGIRDWRGGDVQLRRVSIENFAFGFWGIQSDVNSWTDVQLSFNHVGAYLGPRCDQFTCIALYTFFNDRALDIDRNNAARFIGCQFVGDGLAGTNPIKIHSAWAKRAHNIDFDDCWFEHFQGAAVIEAFVEVSVGDAVTSSGVHFRNPSILTNNSANTPRSDYLVKVDNATEITIAHPGSEYWTNLSALVYFVGTTNPKVWLTGADTSAAVFGYVNGGSGVPQVTTMEYGGTLGRMTFGGGLESVVNADGAVALRLGIGGVGSGWDFRQVGTSPYILELKSLVDNKEFQVAALGGNKMLRLTMSDTAASCVARIAETAGSKVGFFGAAPVVQQAATTDATDLASAITLVNALKANLRAYGLKA